MMSAHHLHTASSISDCFSYLYLRFPNVMLKPRLTLVFAFPTGMYCGVTFVSV